jgi:EAL domain-containing protein (putative c-di-GMP-specific phosphodiesterase class I)
MNAQTDEKFELEHDLRKALRNGELHLHYQPIVEILSGTIVSVEALLRWQHPVHGLLPPDSFIHLAEENGSIGRIGEWVIGEALRQCALWRDAGLPNVGMAVNVSAAQFEGPIVDIVGDALRRNGVPGSQLTIELTESVLVHSVASPRRTIDELKQLGLKLSIDDFGTGYSSLSYLERFPIDKLKIDRSFMPTDVNHSRSGLIASAVIALGESLDMTIIAEGVETKEQCEFVLSKGCGLAQGFLYSPALPADEIAELLGSELSHRILA